MVVESSLANLKHFEGKWKSGQTRTIRVPIVLADEILACARRLDSGNKSHDTVELAALKAELESLKSERGYQADLKRIQQQKELEERNRELVLKVAAERKASVEAQTELERLRRDCAIAKSQLHETRVDLEEASSQLFTQTALQISFIVDLPDAATLLNQLKSNRKKSRADLGDVEAILEMIEQADLKPAQGNLN
jgi:chromosome segregation ATPase